jgi:hypothetical protein
MNETTERINRLESVLAELEAMPSARKPVVVVAAPAAAGPDRPTPVAPAAAWMNACLAAVRGIRWDRRAVRVGGGVAVLALLALAWLLSRGRGGAPGRPGELTGEFRRLAVAARSDPGPAIIAATALVRAESGPTDLINCAAVLAAAAECPGDPGLAEHRAAYAVLYLRQAVRRGARPADFDALPAFASLRGRADYRAAISGPLP